MSGLLLWFYCIYSYSFSSVLAINLVWYKYIKWSLGHPNLFSIKIELSCPSSPQSITSWSASLHQAETSEKAHKEKKKKNRRFGREQQQEGATPTIRINIIKTGEQKKKNKDRSCSDMTTQDVSQLMCWNCNQKGHYSNACPKPSKN